VLPGWRDERAGVSLSSEMPTAVKVGASRIMYVVEVNVITIKHVDRFT